ncbi:MAG: hypothetical protein FWE60_00270 [Oscillospiraceae bacterium]|nr:hypothetical protein [Oscillospiraceae bacterium]
MKDHYDFSKGVKNPYAAHLKKHGCKITVTRGEGDNKKIVKEYFRTPEEIAESAERRKNNKIQTRL